jgi:dolichol-phosphate mannosyltransferase
VTWIRRRTKVPAIVVRYPEVALVTDISSRLKPVNDDGVRLSAGDKN